MKNQLAITFFSVITCLFTVQVLKAQTPTDPVFAADEPAGWDRLLYATFDETVRGVVVTSAVGIDNEGRVFTSTENLLDQTWISVFNVDGTHLESWDGGASGTPGRITSKSLIIEADNNDNMYIDLVDTAENKSYVYVYDKTGAFSHRIGYDFLDGGIAVSSSLGKIIMNDDADTSVHIFNLNGTFDRKIKRPDMAPDEKFKFGDNMVYDEGVGRFYFKQRTNPRSFLMYDEDFNLIRQITGTYVTSFLNATSGGFDVHPTTHDLWLQIGTNQNYFIIDTLGNLKGRFLDTSLGATNTCKRFRFDKVGNIYTADPCKGLIYRYTPKVTSILKPSETVGSLVAYPSPNSGSFRIQSPFPLPFKYAELITPDGKTERHESLDISTELRGLVMVHLIYENGSRYHTKVFVEY